MIIKKGWFSQLEILEIHQQIKRESSQQDPNEIIHTPNTEKQSNRTEPQSNNNRNTRHLNTEKDEHKKKKMNVEDIKRIMSKKTTTLPSLRNQDKKILKTETEKKTNYEHTSQRTTSRNNAELKLVRDKIGVLLKNTNRNSKSGWEIWMETQAKMIRQGKNAGISWDEKRKATQVKQTIQQEEINHKVLAKGGKLKKYWDRIKQYRQNRTF